MAAAAETAGEVADHVADGIGVAGDAPAEQPREPGASAPAHALRNLVVAERRRIAATQMRMLKLQVSFAATAEDRAAAGAPGFRARLAAANGDLNDMEETTHGAEGIFKTLIARWKEAAKGRAEVRILIDPDWRVVRAHIRAPHGHKLAGQLLADHSGWFDLNALHLLRHVVWEPAELAECEAVIDGRGALRQVTRNEKGGAFLDEFDERLRSDGLPHTRVLTGD
jgi:hypothetical protein